MIALSLGYYGGGALAEKYPSTDLLGRLLFFTGLCTAFLPYVAAPVMESTLGRFAGSAAEGQGPSVFGPLMICALLISLPASVFGMTSPFLIRLASYESQAVGMVSGRIFACSTVGSIIGTFLPALVLVPRIGTTLSFLCFAVPTVFIAFFLIRRDRAFFVIAGVAALTVALVFGVYRLKVPLPEKALVDTETEYQSVRIYRVPYTDRVRKDPTHATVMVTEGGFGLQSMWMPDRSYTDSWQDLFAPAPLVYRAVHQRDPERMLIVGLGGAVAARAARHFAPALSVDGVELDGGLIKAATPHFPLGSMEGMRVFISDGRPFLRSCRTLYDVIIIDVFRPPHIPFHLATAEAFTEARRLLKPGGMIFMNTGSRGESKVFQGLSQTLAAVFPRVYYCEYPTTSAALFTNRLLVGLGDYDPGLDRPELERAIFDTPDEDWRRIFDRVVSHAKSRGQDAPAFVRVARENGSPIFTDDCSSLEQLTEREFFSFIVGL
jgi:hypothetical protein